MVKIKRKELEIQMASMSDIAFLLIIFFILSMSFIYRQGLKISLPKKNAPPVVVQLKNTLILKLNTQGELFSDDKKISIEKLKTANKVAAVIKIDRNCKYNNVVSLIETLQKKNITKISLKKI